MRIGIITFHSVTNYGALMQSLGLYTFLKNNAPDARVEIINYQPWSAVREYLRTGFYRNRDFSYFIKSARFSNFLMKYIRVSGTPIYTRKGLSRISSRYDLILAGSDEIWRLGGIRGDDFSYFLDFCSKHTIKASYAPSVSEKTDISKYSTLMSNHLQSFSYLSARDKYSKEIVESLTGRPVTEVLDPTFLIDYQPFCSTSSLVDKPYILIYGQPDKESAKSIGEFAKLSGLITVSVNKRLDWCDRSFPNASPSQWLWLFKNAKTIITQFYHGIIFAIKNEKPFVVLRHPGKKAKVNGLAEALGFESVVLDGPLTVEGIRKAITTLRFEIINEEIDKRACISRSYLQSVLAESLEKL